MPEPLSNIEPEKIDRIIVGLGNPGQEYAGTRHNLGYRALDEFLRALEIKRDFKAGRKSRTQRIRVGGSNVLLVRPTTFMNRSGDALKPLLQKYELEISDVLVVHDDMDISSGKAKMRQGGGAAGHKGIIDISEKCGAGFTRIKIGIGVPENRDNDSDIDWVLGKPTEEELESLESVMPGVIEAMRIWIADGTVKAMTRLNTVMNAEGKEESKDKENDVPDSINESESDER
jgi:PTH1 family peptidyl-tRNA hydrolase